MPASGTCDLILLLKNLLSLKLLHSRCYKGNTSFCVGSSGLGFRLQGLGFRGLGLRGLGLIMRVFKGWRLGLSSRGQKELILGKMYVVATWVVL